MLSHSVDLDKSLRPLLEVVPTRLVCPDVEVFKLSVRLKSEPGLFLVIPVSAVLVPAKPKTKKETQQPGGCSSGYSESGGDSDTSDLGKGGRSSGQDESGVESFVSSADSSVASDDEDDAPLVSRTTGRPPQHNNTSGGEDGGAESETHGRSSGLRLARGTHTMWQNEYFFLTDDRDTPFLQMRVKARWLDDEHMGRLPTRKSLRPKDFGEGRCFPSQTVLALRAWMLFRWQGNDKKFLQKRARLLAWGSELDTLRAMIAEHGGRRSLHSQVHELILRWAPSALDSC